MINLAAVGSASGAGEYYSQDNYYTTSELTEASEWFGRGAEALGLQGAVEEQAFVDKINQLREPYNTVAVLYFLQQQSVGEIAQRLGRPRKTVQTQLFRARGQLKAQLAPALG